MTYNEILAKARAEYPDGTYIMTKNYGVVRVWGKIELSKYFYALKSKGMGVIYDFKKAEWAQIVEQK